MRKILSKRKMFGSLPANSWKTKILKQLNGEYIASDIGIIEKKGAWFSYKGQRLGQGRDSVRDDLRRNNKLLEESEALVMASNKEKLVQKAACDLELVEP